MDNDMRKSVEISIVGNLHYRQIIVVGGGGQKIGCLTTNSNTAGVGTQKTSIWFLEYEEIDSEFTQR